MCSVVCEEISCRERLMLAPRRAIVLLSALECMCLRSDVAARYFLARHINANVKYI